MEETRQGTAAFSADLEESLPGAAEVAAHDVGSVPTAVGPASDPASDAVPEVFKPNHVMAVATSLSPRPDKLTKINGGSLDSVAGSRGASVSAPAKACADSMAGTIPSVRDSSRKASIASASVMGSYCARPTSASQECSGPTPG